MRWERPRIVPVCSRRTNRVETKNTGAFVARKLTTTSRLPAKANEPIQPIARGHPRSGLFPENESRRVENRRRVGCRGVNSTASAQKSRTRDARGSATSGDGASFDLGHVVMRIDAAQDRVEMAGDGLVAQARATGVVPTIDVGLVKALRAGKVAPVAAVARFAPEP